MDYKGFDNSTQGLFYRSTKGESETLAKHPLNAWPDACWNIIYAPGKALFLLLPLENEFVYSVE